MTYWSLLDPQADWSLKTCAVLPNIVQTHTTLNSSGDGRRIFGGKCVYNDVQDN